MADGKRYGPTSTTKIDTSRPLDTYENIIVGNFLFGLGIDVGLKNDESATRSICANLLQQTPYDTRLCDVLLVNSRFFRLIEFKREIKREENTNFLSENWTL